MLVHPNPRQIRLTRLDRLTITTWMRRLNCVARKTSKSSMTILNRLPIETSYDSLTGITSWTRMAIRINLRPWALCGIDWL